MFVVSRFTAHLFCVSGQSCNKVQHQLHIYFEINKPFKIFGMQGVSCRNKAQSMRIKFLQTEKSSQFSVFPIPEVCRFNKLGNT